jgi:Ca2+-transporting ATPase
MEHKPRPLNQPVLTGWQWVRIIVLGLIIAAGTLFLEAQYAADGKLAATMGATVFSVFCIFAGLVVRDETRTAFNRDIFVDRHQLLLYGLAVLLTFLATELGFLQSWLGTTSLTGNQWMICFVVALSLVVVDEVIKVFMRLSRKQPEAQAVKVTPAVDVR